MRNSLYCLTTRRLRQILGPRPRHHLPATAVLLVVAAGLFWLGYYTGRSQLTTTTLAVQQEWIAEQETLLAARKAAIAKHDALARRLGQLQARLVRLESIGQQLLDSSELDLGEFSLSEPPALGGPQAPLAADDTALAAELAGLAEQLQARYEQWQVLLGLTMTNQVADQGRPAGRPIADGWITSRYGKRQDPFNGQAEFHRGVDYATRAGSPIFAVANGVVTATRVTPGYGKLVEIRHPDGYSTRYAHCQTIDVQTGDTVRQGQIIATVGSTGRATGPHVHFEVHQGGRHVDPARFTQASTP